LIYFLFLFSSKITLGYIDLNDERYDKGIRIRYKIFNELDYTRTSVLCRNSICGRIKQTRIVQIPNIDEV